ncbi:hypothetical protein IGI04_005486 [Brassica rapa subsp. trilocularis]|uniref:Uncharacterized protein n=1 Tax=Brassica rapa subsp. trilocularis TaxID=1813537 RepID=A0ABQ7NE46_BRACM|nr:hypothetical protein IGI04_005486 [Brassica rapa subsp. trilocularis]
MFMLVFSQICSNYLLVYVMFLILLDSEKKRLKNLVAKLLLSSAKLFSLRNYVSSKSLWTDWTWSMQARDAKPVPADESCQIPMAQQDVDGEIDSSDDGMPSPPLEAYTNRLRPFGVQFDAENGS